jgi:hypothetical protein
MTNVNFFLNVHDGGPCAVSVDAALALTGLHLSLSEKSSFDPPAFQISFFSWFSPHWQIIKMAAGLQLFKTGYWEVKLAARYQREKRS